MAFAVVLAVASIASSEMLLRRDGVPVKLLKPGQLEKEMSMGGPKYPFKKFSPEYVNNALKVIR